MDARRVDESGLWNSRAIRCAVEVSFIYPGFVPGFSLLFLHVKSELNDIARLHDIVAADSMHFAASFDSSF